MNEPTPIQQAVPQLIELAAHVRPDWSEQAIRGAVIHAATIGMTWEQTLIGLPRLMADPDARPRELVPDHRDPLRRRSAVDPQAVRRRAAEIRWTLPKGRGR